jgi:diacylglycerol kinase family enzyme
VEGLAAQADRLVVVGGDGTLRETAAILHHRDIACVLAFVPMGSANVLARELGIPQDPVAAVQLLSTGAPRTLDAGRIVARDGDLAEVFFLAMLEIGFGAVVVHRVHRWRRRNAGRIYRAWGDLLYAGAGIRSLLDGQRPACRVQIDDRELPGRFRGAVITNIRTDAKGWSLTPGAAPGDGLLDFFGRRSDDTATLVRTYANARRRRETREPSACRCRGRHLNISAERLLDLQADGEPLAPQSQLTVEVIPGAAVIVAPADTSHPDRQRPNPHHATGERPVR